MNICMKIVLGSIRQSTLLLAIVVAVLLLPPRWVGAASFRGLGDLPGSGYGSIGNGVSGDGTVAVGWSDSAQGEAFRWTLEMGMQGLGVLPGNSTSTACGVSTDGTVVVGWSQSGLYNQAFRWTPEGGMVGLGFLPGDNSSTAYGVSADGTMVVGSSANVGTCCEEAFRWTPQGGMVSLGFLPGGSFSVAFGVSADGTVAVGWSSSAQGREAFRWTPQGGMIGLGDLPGGTFTSEARGVSADGTVVVGGSSGALSTALTWEAFRWTPQGGMISLGFLPGDNGSYAYGVSADGTVVVGSSWSAQGSNPKAFLWDSTHGMRRLQDVLTQDFGLDLTGWQLSWATGISADGRTVVGYGRNPSGYTEAWIAYLDSSSNEGPIPSDVMATPNPVAVNTAITLTAQVTDTSGAIIANPAYRIDSDPFVPMAAQDGAFDEPSEAVIAVIPSFAMAGVHEVCVSGTVTAYHVGPDDCTFLVVYNPNGGYVTGHGWIDSPPSACHFAACTAATTGKANFGFVSKYQQGATVPTGRTAFQFKAGNLNFDSESYQWLVVAGAKAMYKGTGTINGGGSYGFLLSAIDAALTPSTAVDRFRIKIWDKLQGDTVVYDNQVACTDQADTADPCAAISSGNIIIHKQ